MLIPLIATAAAGAAYAIGIERHWWAIRGSTIACLPPGFPPMRILHISDLHFRSGQGLKTKFVQSLAKNDWDLIVGTGDFLGDAKSNAALLSMLKPLEARIAKIFVLGSNDYYSPSPKNPLKYFGASGHASDPSSYSSAPENPWQEMVSGLMDQGWRYFSNDSGVLHHQGVEFDVTGLDDAHIGRSRAELAPPRVDEKFRLAVAHSPDSLPGLLPKEFDLAMFGHTHGGQVCVPLFGALVTNCAIPRSWAKGLHRAGRTWVHISAGLGTSMYAPFRFACRPEVTIVDLVGRSS